MATGFGARRHCVDGDHLHLAVSLRARKSCRAVIVHRPIRPIFAYHGSMSDPDANMPRINGGMVYLGACLIAGIRQREKSL